MNTPTYTISTKIIDLVARIAEKLGAGDRKITDIFTDINTDKLSRNNS